MSGSKGFGGKASKSVAAVPAQQANTDQATAAW
jgi:hypothetical protein